jgi:hypothetical protein
MFSVSGFRASRQHKTVTATSGVLLKIEVVIRPCFHKIKGEHTDHDHLSEVSLVRGRQLCVVLEDWAILSDRAFRYDANPARVHYSSINPDASYRLMWVTIYPSVLT